MIPDIHNTLSYLSRQVGCCVGPLFIFLIAVGVVSCQGENKDEPTGGMKKESDPGTLKSVPLPYLLEVVVPLGTTLNEDTMFHLLRSGNDSVLLYRWKNRLVAYGKLKDTARLRSKILNQVPSSTVIIYNEPFYHFNRKQCASRETAMDWNHIILMANLVADTLLQREYMEYHARQQKDWPEVGQGFCRADFQQLLLYRNDRQLMLVISIPEGTTLDELNPRTTENNPKVESWNQLMKKYQEGVKGTNPGEVWIQLQPVKSLG